MRTKFLVNPKLQIRHLAWTVGAVIVCSLVGYLLFEAMLRSALAPKLTSYEEWLGVQYLLRLGFGVIFLLLLIAVGVHNYLLFHSIVGPLYALERGLNQVAAGELDDEIKIRNTDQLKDLIQAFEDMKKSLRKKLPSSLKPRS